MSELRTRMVRDMTLRGFSPRTHQAYIGAVVGLAKYYRRSPDQITNDEVQAYLAHLIQERKRSWSTCSQAAHAFRFLYHVTLGHPRTEFHVPAPKVSTKPGQVQYPPDAPGAARLSVPRPVRGLVPVPPCTPVGTWPTSGPPPRGPDWPLPPPAAREGRQEPSSPAAPRSVPASKVNPSAIESP